MSETTYNKPQANAIVFKQLEEVYSLCKIPPSPPEWNMFLETQSIDFNEEFIHLTCEQAFKKFWVFRHWYNRKYHGQLIDELMKLKLNDAVLYNWYKLNYCK